MSTVSGKTQVVGIIGNPVKHSLSPAMHNAAFAACDLDYVYVPFFVAPENLGNAISGLKALGVCGFNVTIPYKTDIIPYLDYLDQTAEEAGAVNTVLIKNGKMIGHNTDGDGLVCSLAEDLDFIPGDGTVMLIGAGGAARGAIAALCRAKSQRIIVTNRSVDKANALKLDMNRIYPEVCIDVINANELNKSSLSTVTLLVNTTSIGMNGDKLHFLDLSMLPKSAKIYDMVYSPPITPLLYEASEIGMLVSNGLGMLAAQGELAFNIWTGITPPKGYMKRVLEGLCGS